MRNPSPLADTDSAAAGGQQGLKLWQWLQWFLWPLRGCAARIVADLRHFGLLIDTPAGPVLLPSVRAGILLSQLVVTLGFTLGKRVFFIGGVWLTANQGRRELRLTPFAGLVHTRSLYALMLNVAGNLWLFCMLAFVITLLVRQSASCPARPQWLPAGLVRLVHWWWGRPVWAAVPARPDMPDDGVVSSHRLRHLVYRTAIVTGIAAFAIETLQFVFAWGYSDVDDVIYDVIGATVGVIVAMHWPFRHSTLALLAAAIAAVVLLAFMAASLMV
ncbi:VanZ family protein [Corynebacterium choanae]|uniref:VanZ like family protein n=1 Tax=Corynebacterium choanae TaxID=1862358 RepID=A0A3G6J905_9CORY|nr:VanZ family protein [Corynebacterium choanae]AZA13368.1 VanZ like family protein [Corynebacterium choanae]